MALLNILSMAVAALLLPLAHAQSDIPTRPTVDLLSMIGSGCPVGGGGIGSGAVNGTPVFKFTMWDLNLADLDPDAPEPPEPPKVEGALEKFCVEEMVLGNGPVGYQVRIPAVTVGGVADLEEGSVLGIFVETSLGGEESGSGETKITASDITDGAFEVRVETDPEHWSECVGDDGVVPTIRLKTTLALYREGDEETSGTVGSDDGSLENALSVHFQSIYRECE